MKYIVLIGDGMADYPIESLNGGTPLSVAKKPSMDYIASKGINGTVATVPAEMTPESDTANLAVMGYDPLVYSRGRSPLEAASMGIEMSPEDTAIRVNLVALSDKGEPYEQKVMLDHSSDEITTEEADILIKAIQEKFGDENKHFYTGVSYRHCLIWKNCFDFDDFSRPHDIINRQITEYLPYKAESAPMLKLMKDSFELLNNHPVNALRESRGLKKANSLWAWSPGKKAFLPSFSQRTGLNGSVICAVDLIKGIGLCAGMDVPKVEGATGNIDTNFSGKAQMALDRLLNEGRDLVYIHVEAPDECGHRGEIDKKIKSIELIDSLILTPMMKTLREAGEDFKILMLPDHPTPIARRTHTHESVPFVIYKSYNEVESGLNRYDENSGIKGGVFIEKGFELMSYFVNI